MMTKWWLETIPFRVGGNPRFEYIYDQQKCQVPKMEGFRKYLGGGFKYVWNFHHYLGKISNLTNIFQMG